MDPQLPKSATALTLDDLRDLSNHDALPPWTRQAGPAFRALAAIVHAAGGPTNHGDSTLLAMLERVRVRPEGLYADGMFALWVLDVIGDVIEKVSDVRATVLPIVGTIKPDSRSGTKREVVAFAPESPPPGSLWRTNWHLAARAAIAIEWLLQERAARVVPFRFVVDFLELEQPGKPFPEGPAKPKPKYQSGGVVQPARVPIFGEHGETEAAPMPRRMAHARILEVDTEGIAGVLNRLRGTDEVHPSILSVTVRRRPKHAWAWWLKVATLELFRWASNSYVRENRWTIEEWDAAAHAVAKLPPPPTPTAAMQTDFEKASDAAAALEEAAEEDADAGGPLDPRVGGALPEVMRVPTFDRGVEIMNETVSDAPSRRASLKDDESVLLAIEDTGLFCVVCRWAFSTPEPITDATPPGTARAWLKFRMAELGYSAPMMQATLEQTATMLPTEIAALANKLSTVTP